MRRLGRAVMAMSVIVVTSGVMSAAASAQGDDGSVPTTTIRSTRVDDPQATVNAVTIGLVAIAAVTAVLTVAYWMHTRPGRRDIPSAAGGLDDPGTVETADEEP